MPTPPPWCKDTQVAPLAVLTKAFKIGQSAIASDPSFIASVSLLGDATDPQSKWSLPITMGAFSSPLFTMSFKAKPNLTLSLKPNQQILDGNPWNSTFSLAILIQWQRALSSLNISKANWSVLKISFLSPDNATHLNGPLPSQNNGLIYSGTKPGISNAFLTPAFSAWALILLP